MAQKETQIQLWHPLNSVTLSTDHGSQQFFGAPFEIPRPDSTPEPGQGQAMLLVYPPMQAGPMSFSPNYPQSWNRSLGTVPLEPLMVAASSQGNTDGFINVDPQGRGFFHGANMGVEQRQPLPLPPPPPMLPPSHLTQMQQGGRSYSGGGDLDALPGFGWPVERRDGFGGGQD